MACSPGRGCCGGRQAHHQAAGTWGAGSCALRPPLLLFSSVFLYKLFLCKFLIFYLISSYLLVSSPNKNNHVSF